MSNMALNSAMRSGFGAQLVVSWLMFEARDDSKANHEALTGPAAAAHDAVALIGASRLEGRVDASQAIARTDHASIARRDQPECDDRRARHICRYLGGDPLAERGQPTCEAEPDYAVQ